MGLLGGAAGKFPSIEASEGLVMAATSGATAGATFGDMATWSTGAILMPSAELATAVRAQP